MCCSLVDSSRLDGLILWTHPGVRTSAWSIPQVRQQVCHLLREVYGFLFGGVFVEFEGKDSCNEGGVTFTPPDDGFGLGWVACGEGGFTLGRGGSWEDGGTFTF